MRSLVHDFTVRAFFLCQKMKMDRNDEKALITPTFRWLTDRQFGIIRSNFKFQFDTTRLTRRFRNITLANRSNASLP